MSEWNSRAALKSMIARCHNPNDSGYAAYGKKGVRVCDRWRFGDGDLSGLDAFVKDIGPRPSEKHSVDRIDPVGNYEPSNVRFATTKEQGRNRRHHHMITHNGETLILTDWCERIAISPSTVRHRIKKGLSVADALTPPAPRFMARRRLQISVDIEEEEAREFMPRFAAAARDEHRSVSAQAFVCLKAWLDLHYPAELPAK